jgi:peptidoglycan/xylan/chitin deacetylase (PgdA/CDA1 family)
MIRQLIIRACDAFDGAVAYPLLGSAAPAHDGEALTVLLFHRLFLDEELAQADSGFLHERVTVRNFEAIVSHFSKEDYLFVTPRGVLAGRHLGRRSVMISFDDGYADNLRALPILERYDANAVIFVSPGPVIRREAFWWDVVHREATKRKIQKSRISRMVHEMRMFDFGRIQDMIARSFGHDAFAENYRVDRPMTAEELVRVVGSGRVEIGNHTFDHASLMQGEREAIRQVSMAQDALLRLTGEAPVSFSFPHGLYSETAIEAVSAAGPRFAANVDYHMNSAGPGGIAIGPSACPDRFMRVSRMPIFGDRDIDAQIAASCGRVSLGRTLAASAKYLAALRTGRIHRSGN